LLPDNKATSDFITPILPKAGFAAVMSLSGYFGNYGREGPASVCANNAAIEF
jgi:hypothetical protein